MFIYNDKNIIYAVRWASNPRCWSHQHAGRDTCQRERLLYWQPTGPNPLNHQNDFSIYPGKYISWLHPTPYYLEPWTLHLEPNTLNTEPSTLNQAHTLTPDDRFTVWVQRSTTSLGPRPRQALLVITSSPLLVTSNPFLWITSDVPWPLHSTPRWRQESSAFSSGHSIQVLEGPCAWTGEGRWWMEKEDRWWCVSGQVPCRHHRSDFRQSRPQVVQ